MQSIKTYFWELGWRVFCRDAATTAVATPDDPPKKQKTKCMQNDEDDNPGNTLTPDSQVYIL